MPAPGRVRSEVSINYVLRRMYYSPWRTPAVTAFHPRLAFGWTWFVIKHYDRRTLHQVSILRMASHE